MTTTWLEFLGTLTADARDGALAARTEVETDGWTRETARKYLAAIGAGDSIGNSPGGVTTWARGYDAAIAWFANSECGRSFQGGGT